MIFHIFSKIMKIEILKSNFEILKINFEILKNNFEISKLNCRLCQSTQIWREIYPILHAAVSTVSSSYRIASL